MHIIITIEKRGPGYEGEVYMKGFWEKRKEEILQKLTQKWWKF